jgi:hypothetical protein
MVVTDLLKFLVVCWVLSAVISGCEQGLENMGRIP